MFNKKYKVDDLYIAMVVLAKVQNIIIDGKSYINHIAYAVKYACIKKLEKTGYCDSKYVNVVNGEIYDSYDNRNRRQNGELCVSLNEHFLPLKYYLKNQQLSKISKKEIIDFVNKLNQIKQEIETTKEQEKQM